MTQSMTALSKMTVREYAKTKGVDAAATTAVPAEPRPHSRRAKYARTPSASTVNRSGARRAASGVGPNAFVNAAAVAKNTSGLSRYGTPLRCGSTKSPVAAISRATSALRPSSGSSSAYPSI